jgi:hypothetical protein
MTTNTEQQPDSDNRATTCVCPVCSQPAERQNLILDEFQHTVGIYLHETFDALWHVDPADPGTELCACGRRGFLHRTDPYGICHGCHSSGELDVCRRGRIREV